LNAAHIRKTAEAFILVRMMTDKNDFQLNQLKIICLVTCFLLFFRKNPITERIARFTSETCLHREIPDFPENHARSPDKIFPEFISSDMGFYDEPNYIKK